MPDRKRLGLIGYLLGGLTAAVMLIAALVVNMSLAADADAGATAAALSPPSR